MHGVDLSSQIWSHMATLLCISSRQIETHYRNQPSNTKVALCKPLLLPKESIKTVIDIYQDASKGECGIHV